MEKNLKQLIAGRLDALFDHPKYTIPFVAKKLSLDAYIKIFKIPDPQTPFYIVFSKSSEISKDILEQCNTIIQ